MSSKLQNQFLEEWRKRQERLSTESGLAVVVLCEDGLDGLVETGNNSICSVLSSSEKFAPQCRKFCGKAFGETRKSDGPLKFKCHAGLECVAVPLETGSKKTTAIVGRAFTKAEDYRLATEKAISGDWSGFAPSAVFENVLLCGSQNIEQLARKMSSMGASDLQPLIQSLSDEEVSANEGDSHRAPGDQTQNAPERMPSGRPDTQNLTLPKINSFGKPKEAQVEAAGAEPKPETPVEAVPEIVVEATVSNQERELPENFMVELLNRSYSEACKQILAFIRIEFGVESLAWLENRGGRLRTTLATGGLRKRKIEIGVGTDDPRMRKLLRDEDSIELKDRTAGGEDDGTIRLFPFRVGNETRSAIVVGAKADDSGIAEDVIWLRDQIGSELEVLRLREEISRRTWLDIALRKFNESLKMIDHDDFWVKLMQTTAELVQAERGSLLIFDEKSKQLLVKAAIGRKADVLRAGLTDIGRRIAIGVFKKGEALVVKNMLRSGFEPSPQEWNYRTGSFISYPLIVGNRRIGVLNVADKTDGKPYGDDEVQLLNSVVPQIAVAVDRASLKNKAGEYEQLSVTDPLTGLLNRRYLEERLAEEIKRSNRHGFPMSFMMIDVDDFKSYNDTFLHPEGDKALKIVGSRLRETLRGADVAARYGGEEFSILLPQTTLDEAETIAERIRANIEESRFPHRQVTVSIGIATISRDVDSPEKLIHCADKALFAAKRDGKNQVSVFRSAGTPESAAVH